MFWFCTKYVFVFGVPHAWLFCVFKYVYVFGTSFTCVFCFEPLMHLDDILFGSFRVVNGTSHFGWVTCLAHLSNLKICVHEYYHLVLILQDYLVTMWCIILMRNSNSKCPLIISSWGCFSSYKKMNITLWGSNMLLLHITILGNVNMRWCHLELILLIILYIGGMLAQTRS